MDGDDLIPQFVIHVCKCLITQDTGIVDNHVDPTVRINGGLDASIAVLGGGLDWNSFATAPADFIDNVIRINQVVDNNLGSVFGKEQAVSSTKPAEC